MQDESRAIRYIPELDGLRGLAIALVVLYHARQEPASWYAPVTFLHELINIGSTGVDLFFVLSGYLITSILLNTRTAPARSYFLSFYGRRTLRIFPLYCIAVAAFFYIELPILQAHGDSLDVARASEQVWYWSYLVNWRDAAGHMISYVGHFWSLGVEEQFYLIWPAVVLFCALRFFPYVCVGVGALSLVMRIALSMHPFMAPELLHEFIHRATITRLDTLAVGALIAAIARDAKWFGRARAQVKLIAPVAIGVYVLTWIAADQGVPFLAETFGYLAIAIVYGCMVLVCVAETNSSRVLCRIARWPLLRSLGRCSYAIYILQSLGIRGVIWCINQFARIVVVPLVDRVPSLVNTPPVLISLFAMVACLGGSYLLALLSWHLIEKHFLALKRFFPYQSGLEGRNKLKGAAAEANA